MRQNMLAIPEMSVHDNQRDRAPVAPGGSCDRRLLRRPTLPDLPAPRVSLRVPQRDRGCCVGNGLAEDQAPLPGRGENAGDSRSLRALSDGGKQHRAERPAEDLIARGCTRKLVYARKPALSAAVRATRRAGHLIEAYRCTYCLHWHIGAPAR